ncbi:MAG: helix-turn-helix domain-containing protein [Clostridia bacterium]|nr:helix-turn-helix domain-containing protein [Clostridia bacterium]
MNNIPVIEKSFFFNSNEHIHIQLSNECKDYIGVLHKHEFIEIVYIISGRATHIIDGNSYSVKKGDISLINSCESHAFYPDETSDEAFIAYDLMFTPNFLDKNLLSGEDFSALSTSFLFYSLLNDETDYKRQFNLIKNCNFELGTIFDKIYYEYKNKKTGYINLIRLYTSELIIKLVRKIQDNKCYELSASQKKIVNDAIEYIQTHYNTNINIEDISTNLFFNKNYISKLFKAEKGMSIHKFVKEIRINEVCRLLRETDNNISDIALSCGFSDMKSFYAAFKKAKGCTPKKYREGT